MSFKNYSVNFLKLKINYHSKIKKLSKIAEVKITFQRTFKYSKKCCLLFSLKKTLEKVLNN